MSFKCWKALGSPTLVQSHIVQKAFDIHLFSPHELIVSFPIEWGGKNIIAYFEVVHVPIDYNFLLGHSWTHAMITIVSSEPRMIRFPHQGKIVMINQLDYCMLKTAI